MSRVNQSRNPMFNVTLCKKIIQHSAHKRN
uniref:Uncharacterized protein n=1 Tax=Rhizophora mucronata TaxID=61149 RepID=A0A2P2NSW0_RHIMU